MFVVVLVAPLRNVVVVSIPAGVFLVVVVTEVGEGDGVLFGCCAR